MIQVHSKASVDQTREMSRDETARPCISYIHGIIFRFSPNRHMWDYVTLRWKDWEARVAGEWLRAVLFPAWIETSEPLLLIPRFSPSPTSHGKHSLPHRFETRQSSKVSTSASFATRATPAYPAAIFAPQHKFTSYLMYNVSTERKLHWELSRNDPYRMRASRPLINVELIVSTVVRFIDLFVRDLHP
ncbi:uncharacterized protein LOC125502004 [Athalia rosae]|uniref:uncharacterized protein LOC125502004 n=1 Tax=Athalia rosae TaxID=37344 RepID=UPI00203473DC|nr:uncharacterized protein LOC125502004 [Athalia rosae]